MRVSESSRLSILVKELVESIPDLHWNIVTQYRPRASGWYFAELFLGCQRNSSHNLIFVISTVNKECAVGCQS